MPDLKPAAPRGKTELRARWGFQVDEYVIDAAISSDGELCAVATGAGEILMLDTATGVERWRAKAHAGGIMAIAFSPRGPLLATTGQDGHARIFDASGQTVAELPGTAAWVEHVAWAPDGTCLATASGRVVRLWTVAGQAMLETGAHDSTVAGIVWRSDGQAFATCCYGGVNVWTVKSGAQPRYLPWKGSLISIAWSPDRKVIACGSQDCSIHFWRLATSRDSEMRGYPFKPKALAWDSRSSMLATGGDATVTVWNFTGKGPEGTEPIQLEGHQALCTVLAFSPRKGVLASGGQDMGVLLWEPRRGSKPIRYAFLDDEVTKLAWHPQHAGLMGADASGNVAFWNVE